MAEPDGIVFTAHVVKIATMTDGGFRVSMDIAENDKDQVKALMDSVNELVRVAIIPLKGVA